MWRIVFSIIVIIVGMMVAIHGAAKSQTGLKQLGERDPIIDALAWMDKKMFRAM